MSFLILDFLRIRLPAGFFAGLEVDGKLTSFGEGYT